MLTLNSRFKDAKKEELSAYQLSRYTSVKQINNIFKWLMPFKFKTLMKIAPAGLKGTLSGMMDFLNGKNILINYSDEGCLPLWNEDEIPLYKGEEKPFLVPYLIEDKNAPAVLIIPGGAYLYVSMKDEGIATAKRFNELGFQAFILSYRTSPSRYPSMQLDMIRAIQLIRKNSEEWGVDSEKIIALGYSAGGHLAMSVNGLYDELNSMTGDLSYIDGRPNAIISGYGMMTPKCKTFNITCDMIILGDDYSEEMSKKISIENLIDETYPPVFMFSMKDDPTVPPEINCMKVLPILKEKNIPCEMHIYDGNRHGFALAENDPQASKWPSQMMEFMKNNGIL